MLSDPPLLSLQLQSATLVKRYKRFLADVITPDGELLTIHCANTGAMTGCATPGDTVWYSTSDNIKRKYPHSWELTQTQSKDWICVNTHRANTLVSLAIAQDKIPELSHYEVIRNEIKYGTEKSRIDLLLQSNDKADCFIEVKSVTLLENEHGYFPDAVTSRGQKHLRELQTIVESGHRAVLFFAVMHSGINNVAAAAHIDKKYSSLLIDAVDAGVEILCYRMHIDRDGISLDKKLPFISIR